ncbi:MULTISPECIES: TetR family transcriptional regulator [Pseudomonas]|uniref:TetR family transcriptional regulator n=3 Tax=Pseudomonas TaxID=286 RepID=A0A0G3GH90_9PSED|nr:MULTISPECIES: TetR family transcriptional regulator [Pseudomonas]AKK00499.1 TetR family transcriptional regulator [Pseudomonas chlororaphis]KIQ59510.1 TetR family transcriptional regulator [Pseudomonas fluorescens]ROM83266.1 TetR family transcriptional regulator [Pseudomonas brassicacearum]BBP65045.1 TetR family transcriptional regulator [Pseudomonas sp. Cab53]
MKVTKQQAQANRAHIVETASALFRERGYDGIGIAELMAAAGFTQGGFYKHFKSKADLMAESSSSGIAQSAALTAGASVPEFVNAYLSREHRDDRATGCTLAALCADAARKEDEVKAAFAAGIETQLAVLLNGAGELDEPGLADARAKYLAIMAHSLGAIILSRACPDDSPLADEILAACRDEILRAAGEVEPEGGRLDLAGA